MLALMFRSGDDALQPNWLHILIGTMDVDGGCDNNNKCPHPRFIGYHPALGCVSYYWCQDDIAASAARYKCAVGLMFDTSLVTCNWEGLASGRMWTPSRAIKSIRITS